MKPSQRSRLALLLLFLLPCSARALSLSEFQEKMRKHVGDLSGKTTAAVQVEVLGSGQVVFSHNGDGKLIPASDAKLITALVALEKLGSGFTFETKVFREGGDLVLMGNGDPYLVSERLWLLARKVARSGIKQVGSIRIANGAFSETYRGLAEFEDSGEPFTAQVTPTARNFNSVEIHVIPGTGGKPRLEAGPLPNGYVVLKNEVSQNSGSGKSLTVKPLGASGGKESFLVSGTIGRKSEPVIVYGTAGDPDAHIASAFAALLRKEGVAVAKDFGGAQPLTPTGEMVAKLESPPLQDLVRLFNAYSNNFMAEAVFQAMGAEAGSAASLAKSRQLVADFLRRHPACAGSTISNGSGLSWDTRISPHCFTETMQFAYRDFQSFADLLSSLPGGGQAGTLRNRFKRVGSEFSELKVRGKTGTLWSKQVVTSLTGVTTAGSGEKILFSLIENDERTDPALLRGLKDWEDKCVELVQQLRI